jgi:hypothetical protein
MRPRSGHFTRRNEHQSDQTHTQHMPEDQTSIRDLLTPSRTKPSSEEDEVCLTLSDAEARDVMVDQEGQWFSAIQSV